MAVLDQSVSRQANTNMYTGALIRHYNQRSEYSVDPVAWS